MPNCKRVFYLIFSHKIVSITYTNYSLWQNTKFPSCFTGSFCLLYEFNVLMPAIFILTIALLTKDGQFLVSRTSSPLADLYSTSTLEHHHFDQCIMILSTKVSEASKKEILGLWYRNIFFVPHRNVSVCPRFRPSHFFVKNTNTAQQSRIK